MIIANPAGVKNYKTPDMFIMDNLWQRSEFVSVKMDTEKYNQVNKDNEGSI